MPPPNATLTRRSPVAAAGLHPALMYQAYLGLPKAEVPDVIEFVLSDRYLNRSHLFPRQATILKTIFLQDDSFTAYDEWVLEQWVNEFERSESHGISPDIEERIQTSKAWGRKWLREVVAVIGRRGSKGYLGGVAGAYVLWNYLALGNPQAHYGIDEDKRLTSIVFAAKKGQARDEQWRDIANVILGGPCFQPYVSQSLAESLTVRAPIDFRRMAEREAHGIDSSMDQATFAIVPKESTATAGRGPAAFCLDPSTPVLTTDLCWIPIGEVKEGEHLIGPDEEPSSKGKQRKLRDAEVTNVWRTRQPARRLTFDDGSEVVCSTGHRWMVRDGGRGGTYKWREAGRLKPGNAIRRLVDPWEEDDSFEAGYLAGFFDGEGCIIEGDSKQSAVLFSQKPGPVLDRVLTYLRDLGYDPRPWNAASYEDDAVEVQQWHLRGHHECLRFLGQVKPTRLYNKAESVWVGRSLRGGHTPNGRYPQSTTKTIVAIEELPEQELVDIETTTHTFIANGLISHNSQFYDEMAHVVAAGANRSAEEVWDAATPALDQFRPDEFIWEGSSPWQMTGQFYTNYQNALARHDDGSGPVSPDSVMLQLASWDTYEDWEMSEQLGLGKAKRPIQTYDAKMKTLERIKPETFRVERLAQFATVLDVYLPTAKVEAMFGAWGDRVLEYQSRGRLDRTYKAHADPGKSNDRFGFAIGHTEPDPEDPEIKHVVFDVIHAWDPADAPDHQLDYVEVEEDLWDYVERFMPFELTFDQWNCLAADTLVPTSQGLLRVDEIVGDLPAGRSRVLDMPVQSQHEEAVIREGYRRGTSPTRRLVTKMGYVVEATDEHRIWVRRAKDKPWHPERDPGWVTAGEVAVGDWVRVRRGNLMPTSMVDLTPYHLGTRGVSQHWGVSRASSGRWVAGGWDPVEQCRVHLGTFDDEDEAAAVAHAWRQDHAMSRHVTRYPEVCDEAFAELLGFYVAEGDLSGRWGTKDREVLGWSVEAAQESFGGTWDYEYTTEWQGDHEYGWVRGGPQVAGFFEVLGANHRSSDAQMPACIRRSPRDVVAAFLRGLFEGDGTVVVQGEAYEEVYLSTTSQRLGEEVQQLLLSLGIFSTRWEGTYLYKGERKARWRVKMAGHDLIDFAKAVGFRSTRKTAELDEAVEQVLARGDRVGRRRKNALDGDQLWVRVTDIEESEADCYDLWVPGPERFIGNGLVVHNSASIIAKFRRKAMQKTMPKRVDVYEKTATMPLNWKRWETFKTALGMGWVHAPEHEIAELELKFLRELPTQGQYGKVDHPEVGPVQSKDVADALCDVVYSLIGSQVEAMVDALSGMSLDASQQGGISPYPNGEKDIHEAMSGFTSTQAGLSGLTRSMRGQALSRGRGRKP